MDECSKPAIPHDFVCERCYWERTVRVRDPLPLTEPERQTTLFPKGTTPCN